jgi:hypothetical protein
MLPYLQFDVYPRLDPISSSLIKVNTNYQVRESTKWAILSSILETDYNKVSIKDKKKYVHCISSYHSYMGGYYRVIGEYGTFKVWYEDYKKAKKNGKLEKVFERKTYVADPPYIEKLECTFPGFVHECYRYSTSVLGHDARLPTLLNCMQEYAKVHYPNCRIRRNLSLTTHHFRHFFHFFDGSFTSHVTKPRLNDRHVEARLHWALKWKQWLRLPKEQRHCVFLDEKWFYTTTKRRKMRKLPQHPLTETPEDAFVPQPKTLSRRYPVKVMFQGIASRPYPEYNFNGCIMLKRCSKKKYTKRLAFNQAFDDSYHLTNLLKHGDWKYTCENIDTTSLISEVVDLIHDSYGLDGAVSDSLCFSYNSTTKNDNKKVVRILQDDKNAYLLKDRIVREEGGAERLLTLTDLHLYIHVPKNTEVEEDITCDSSFMMESIHEIGSSIRASMYWVPQSECITLFMDNAGGHGKESIKDEYVLILKDRYKIIVEWQVPNSPETNLLDLGFWATLQAIVERLHRLKRMDTDALARTVRDAFEQMDSNKVENIYERWEYVLDLIIHGKGRNDFVEKNRGLTKSLDVLPNVPVC